MTDTNADAARARGQALRSARVARARSIRRRIVAGSVALFVAAWLLIAIVLVSGHDPALAKKAATTSSAATTVASTTTSTAASSDTSTATSSDTTTGTSSGTSSGGSVSSVTTSQS